MSYCEYIPTIIDAGRRALHQEYHDHHYGFPLHDDNELFGRLLLEINQAGLSWETILKKEPYFRKAYADYHVNKVAAFTEDDRSRLLADKGIIRNKLKIDAAIENARAIQELRTAYGSFENWLTVHHPLPKEGWVKLFKRHFKFVGEEIVGEFLMSIGVLPGAHDKNCPVYQKILRQKPMWTNLTRKI